MVLQEKAVKRVATADAVAALEEWFRRNARVLPWRRTRDPYAIWISEVMLQQTQVATVIPYYHRFLEKFPTVTALAEAPLHDVLAAWSGLGYYSRARNLQRGARHLLDQHGGTFPRHRDELLEVPGIGPYTAGAIASIAFDEPAPIVDGNVQRVFARVYALREIIESRAAQAFFWERAREWVEAAKSPRALNQALMELGATVCIKGKPRCDACPIRGHCLAFRSGVQETLPLRKERRKPVDVFWIGVVLASHGKLFLHKNKKGEWWSDLWDFPHVEVGSARELAAKAGELVDRIGGVESLSELDHQKHTVTHHKIHVAPYVYRLPSPRAVHAPGIEGEWIAREKVAELPLSSLAKKVLGACPTLV